MPDFISRLLSKPYLLLLCLSVFVLAIGINTYSLRGSTESREAGVAAEMLQDHEFLVPQLNGEEFLEKPPLSYWLQAASMRVFGYTAAAARAPSVIAGIATLMLLFFSVKRITQSTQKAWLAALFLMTMASFWMNSRMAGQDILLAFGIAVALVGFWFTRATSALAAGWLTYAFGIFIATFTKGVIGLAIPGSVLFAYLLLEAIWFDRRLVIGNWLRPAVFAVLGLLPLAVWLYALYRTHGADYVSEVVLTNSVDRFAGDYQRGAHAEPFYYYLKKLPETFAPWTVLVLIALWQLRAQFRSNKNLLLVLCWLLAPYILLSFSAGKRPTYLLGIYPAAAILCALFIGNLQTLQLRWRRAGAALIGVLLLAYSLYGAVGLARHKDSDSFDTTFAQLVQLERDGHAIILFAPTERVSGAARFYMQHAVPEMSDEATMNAMLSSNPALVIFLQQEDLPRLRDYRVLGEISHGKRGYAIVASASML
ncbi:MAG: dolichyl-phosphate-mannose-protein mannosyltransferase [Verrucomicrobiaceae bacterium]|nr:dolichyl-phosphate-mannose-protein mannosyltransferase [Verrucomicrobiaceae bacterium]